MATVCTGPGFDVDPTTGGLQLELCGDPARPATYACPTENAARVSEDCGLYVPPTFVRPSQATRTGVNPGGGTVTPTVPRVDTLQFTVVNPSACQPLVTDVSVNHYFTVRVAPGGSAVVGTVTTRTAGQAPFDSDIVYNDSTVTRTYFFKVVDAVSLTTLAGATDTIFSRARVRVPAGEPNAVFARIQHDAFGISVSRTY